MAKKNDAAYEAFLADLKTINPQIEEVLLKDERASAKLKEAVLARSDYSSAMDELKKSREEMNQYLLQEREKIEKWQKWYGDASKEYATAVEKLSLYEEEYGTLDGQRKPVGPTKEEVAKQMEEEFRKRETAYMKFTQDLNRISLEHHAKYKEILNPEEVYKIAGEKNLPLDLAYKEFISDRAEADRKAQYEADLKAAREEGFKEAMTKHNLPNVTSEPAYVHALDAKDVGTDTRARVDAAVKSFLNKS